MLMLALSKRAGQDAEKRLIIAVIVKDRYLWFVSEGVTWQSRW
jgi:hypothetical protein